MKSIACSVLVLAVMTVLAVSSAGAQNSAPSPDQSLGDYARKVHKDPNAAKAKPKVFDNDSLPKDDKLSVVGQQPSEAPAAPDSTEKSAAPEAKDTAKPADDDQAKKQAAWKSWQDRLTGQKQQVDLASRELDVTQREYQLRAAAMYADVGNRLRNSADWDKQEAQYKQQIADKQKAVDDAKQKLDDLQEEARKAGVPASMRD